MKNLKKISAWILALGGIAVCSCTLLVFWAYSAALPAQFYEDIGWVDAEYLPLIEPYRAVKMTDEGFPHDWRISLYVSPEEKELNYYLGIHNVQKISVQKSIIMVYSPDSLNVTTSGDFKIPEYYWFIIIPGKNIEVGFEKEEEFLEYIYVLNIEEPVWVNPDTAYEEFVRTKCLEWIPDCK
jgi:hypothetical protein